MSGHLQYTLVEPRERVINRKPRPCPERSRHHVGDFEEFFFLSPGWNVNFKSLIMSLMISVNEAITLPARYVQRFELNGSSSSSDIMYDL